MPFPDATGVREEVLDAKQQSQFLNLCTPEFRPLAYAALLTGCRYGPMTRWRVKDFRPLDQCLRIGWVPAWIDAKQKNRRGADRSVEDLVERSIVEAAGCLVALLQVLHEGRPVVGRVDRVHVDHRPMILWISLSAPMLGLLMELAGTVAYRS
jgi:hypothetical protein